MIHYLKALFGGARRRHCRARSRRGVSSSPFAAKLERDRNLSCVTTLVHSSSLQSSTTYKTMDYSTPTTDSSIQVYKGRDLESIPTLNNFDTGFRDWDFYLKSLSANARDSSTASDPAFDPSLLQSVRKLCEMCKAENSEDLAARVYPHINKLFQRSVASIPHSRSSSGLLLLFLLVEAQINRVIAVLELMKPCPSRSLSLQVVAVPEKKMGHQVEALES
ncbi:hypothetical protein AAC387_Pa10g0751 [Persea americana]